MIGIRKAVTSWNFKFLITSILVIGMMFNFDYFSGVNPALQLFTIIKSPVEAVFYLTLSLVAFRHSYKLMLFISKSAPQMIRVLVLVFGLMIALSGLLIYLSFQFNINQLAHPNEWVLLIGLQFVVLFWLLMIETILIKSWTKK